MDIEKNGYVKLPYGFVSSENQKGKFHFNLPLNYKKNLLFGKVPYFAEVNNPAINDVVLGKKKDDLSIQKFLLGKGVLEDAVLDNLDMIVTDRRFNNAGIRRKLDRKYPSIMKKPTASNFLFRDKKQFDLQNPVIGGTSDQLKLLKTAPKITDLKIKIGLDRLRKFNLARGSADDDDDDDDDNNIPGLPSAAAGPSGLPRLGNNDDDDDNDDNDDDDKLNNIQKFLLNQPNERIAEAIAEGDAGAEPRKIAFSKEITKVFPKIKEEIKEEELDFGEADKDEFMDDYNDFDEYDKKTTDSDFEIDLDFFGGDKNKKKLIDNAVLHVGQLNESNKLFIEYLSSNFGSYILSKNKLKIHLESGQFFHDNNITNESIYDFFIKQQDQTKKELLIEVPVGNDFELYVRELLANVVDDDYDVHTNSTSKFLFYNFNTFRLNNRLNPLTIRHSQTVTNEKAISILQSHNWQYFVDQLLHIANGEIRLDDFDLEIDKEFDKYTIIEKTSDNIDYCRKFYEEVFNDIAYFFQKMIKETPDEFLEPLKRDLANEIYFTDKLKEIESHVELLKIFNRFYFKTGRFPGNYTDLILVPVGKKPDFVKTYDQISPTELNEKFQNGASYGIAAVQFLAGLNIHFGGEKQLSQDVMSEFLHNLSWQALTIDSKKINIKFDAIVKLNKNIKRLFRDIDRPIIKTLEFDDYIIDNTRDKVQAIEEEVVNNVINNVKVELPRDYKQPMPNTLVQIENDIKTIKKIKRKTEESLNDVYSEITHDLVTEARNDLLKSVTDYEGEIPMEVINNVTSSYQETPVKKSVRRHIKESIKDRNQQYFKQRKPSVNYKVRERNTKPQLKITDIVNRNIPTLNRSNSVTSIPISDVEMLSRSASLDSISTMKREYNDEEMISRPPSVSSIRDSVNTDIEMSFVKKPNTKINKPIKFINKVPPTKPPVNVKPKEALIKPVKDAIAKTADAPLTAAAKAVVRNKQPITPAAKVVLGTKSRQIAKPTQPIKNPPIISLNKSIDNSKTLTQRKPTKKQAAAIKADVKKKQQEEVIRWRSETDVEMATPVVIGKRKKEFQLQAEAKTKKEN